MRIGAVALVLALALPATATASPQPILGGTRTNVGDFPTTVAILVGGGLCTGTLITPEWVLTAGHCVSTMETGGTQQQLTDSIDVVFDSTNAISSGGRHIGASLSAPNPTFNLNNLGDNDIGLIKLKTPVTDRVPVPLNRDRAKAPAGMLVTMVGFGVNQVGTQNAGIEYTLRDKATVSCNSAGIGSDTNLICFSQQDGKGKCSGDSGGPSFAMIDGKQYQVGVTSFGTNQQCTDYGADTRVDDEIAWVDQMIGPSLKCTHDGVCAPDCGTGGAPVDPDCPTCTKDEECGSMMVCDHGQCVAAPNTPGGLGSTCTTAAECDSGNCLAAGTEMRCSKTCDMAAADSCPNNFDCLPTSDPSTGACWPGVEGGDPGCCSTNRDATAPAMLLFGVVAIGLGRRRRRR